MLDGRRFDKVAEGRAGIGLDNGLPHGLPIVGAISFTDFVDHQFFKRLPLVEHRLQLSGRRRRRAIRVDPYLHDRFNATVHQAFLQINAC